jgi:pilus assembly protein CpaB
MTPRLIAVATRAWAALKARRVVLMVLGAIGFGALAVLGARNYIADRLALERATLQPRHSMVEVVVARRDLRRGEPVGPDTMAVRTMPREFTPGGAVVPARFDTLVGARLLVAMRAGEPLLPASVTSAETGSISSRVRPGIRAMTISVDEVNSLSGMLQPGDRIDLLLSVRPLSAAGMPAPEVTRTVMQGVPVLATGRQSRAASGEDAMPGRPFTSITVEVDPMQAQKLVVAQRSGKLTAVLRNPDDRATIGESRLDVNTLLGLPPAPLPAAPLSPRAQASGVEVIVGGRGQAPAQLGVGGQVPVGAAPGVSTPLPAEVSAPAPASAASSAVPPATPSAHPAMPRTDDPSRPLPDALWSVPPQPVTVPLYR